ncbi:hypothetical protein [Chryseolinea sp. H1M3-3]|uniref:hypothetical protein n=1 Tax=Chryseolinea sp. H1M3-3 TaxID=3034144 RepID=UPI0023EA81BF|nr:hypothetical protein [Chryseolinea sp. H1M3-3]
MTRILITALFILNTICSFGQKNLGIKIYQNTDIFEIRYFESRPNRVEESDKVNFARISLAVDIDTKKGYTHEIEFLIPEVSKSYDNIQYPMNYELKKEMPDFEGQASSYSLRYELSKTLTNKANRLGFNLGIGINPYYVLVEYIPNVETRYYSSTKLYGFVLNMVPRIKYNLSQRFIIDLNVPLKIYDLQAVKSRIKNPLIPIHQQTTINYSNSFFESAYTFRIGLMYKLNK